MNPQTNLLLGELIDSFGMSTLIQTPIKNEYIAIFESLFFENHQFNSIVVYFYMAEQCYIICYDDKIAVIHKANLKQYFSENDGEIQAKLNTNNDYFFGSEQIRTVFQSDTNNKIYIDKSRTKILKFLIQNFESDVLAFKYKKDEAKKKLPINEKLFIKPIIFYIITKNNEMKERANEVIDFSIKNLKKINARNLIQISMINPFVFLHLDARSKQLYALKSAQQPNKGPDLTVMNENYKEIPIQHPYWAKYCGFRETNDKKIIMREYVLGEPLSLLGSTLRLTFSEKISIILQIMISIENFHLNDFMYRNLKPDTILISINKTAVITGFSYAKSINLENCANDNSVSRTTNIGIEYFTSPELYSSDKYSFPTDIYSIGKIINFIFSETDVFLSNPKSPYENNSKPRSNIFNFPRKYQCFFPIFKKCVETDPEKRPNITTLFNSFLYTAYKHFKSTLFYEKGEDKTIKNKDKEIIQKTLNTIYIIRYKQVINWLEKQSDKSKLQHLDNMFDIFNFLSFFKNENQKQLKEHFYSFLNIAEKYEEKLSSKSLFILGKFYEKGKYFSEKIEMAKKYYEKSSEKNNYDALYRLGLIYEKERNFEEAKKYHNRAVKGNAKAHLHLARIFELNNNNPEDPSISSHYELAAEQNIFDAIYLPIKNLIEDLCSGELEFMKLMLLIDENLRILYKNFKFKYLSNIRELNSAIKEMKPFIIFDIITHKESKPLVVISSYNQCIIFKLEVNLEQLFDIFDDASIFDDITILTVNDQYSDRFNDKNIQYGMFIEIESLYNHFQKENPFIYDYYITSIEEFFVNITIKPLIGSIIRRNYYPSNIFSDSSFFQENEQLFQNNEGFKEFDDKEFIYLRKIGNGSFSAVSLNYHLKTKRVFAFKEYFDSVSNIKYFEREKQFYKDIHHEFIIKCYGTIKEKKIFVLEFMSNLSLTDQYILNMEPKERIKLSLSVFLGLKFAHFHGYSHRDLKPINIFIDHNKQYYIGDFSCAKLDQDTDSIEKTQDVGSIIYYSPQTEINKDDERDIYAFGKIFGEIITNDRMILVNDDDNNIDEYIIPQLFNYRSELKNFYILCISADKSNDIIIRMFYLFVLFELHNDVEFNKKFVKSYLSLFKDNNQKDTNFIINHFLSEKDNQYTQYILGELYFSKELIHRSIEYFELSSERNSYAKFKLGELYLNQDINKSIKYLEESSNQNNSKAQFLLGYIYYDGNNIQKINDYFTLTSKNNNLKTQLNLGTLNYFDMDNSTFKFDIHKSIHYLTLSSNQNLAVAQFYLGLIYFEGKYVPKDINKSIHYFELSANQSFLAAQFHLGIIYYEGKYVSRDINKTIHYLTLSSKQNYEAAHYLLGTIYMSNLYIPRDIHKAIYYFSLSAKQNNPYAQYSLGKIYYENKYVARNIDKSIHFLTLSSKNNNLDAHYYLGQAYIPLDINKAIKYLWCSAKKNHQNALYTLGKIYYKGKYITRNINKAIYYLSLSSCQNNSKAQYLLGEIYYNGIFIERDIDKSINYLKQSHESKAYYLLGLIYKERNISKSIHYLTLSSNQNNSDAQFLLGALYYTGTYIERDIKKSIIYLTLSSSRGNKYAHYLLSEIYYEGCYVQQDIKKAIYYLSLPSLSDDSHVLFLLGQIYYYNEVYLHDMKKAIYYYWKSSEQGNPYAQYCLGRIYYEGKYVIRNILKSIHYLELSAKENITDAIFLLGTIYYEFKKQKAISYLTIAANQNYSNAQYLLGIIYYQAYFVPRDIEKSIYYLKLSADQNNSNALFFLGAIYYYGNYLTRNINEALYYLLLSSKQNNPNAQYLLGEIYYFAKYVKQDIEKSIHYLKLSTDKNHPRALYLLGAIYLEGKYISRDIEQSIKYLTLSSKLNNQDAQYLLGWIYYEGILVEPNINKAISYFKLSNNSFANFLLGNIYFEGKYFAKNIDKAIEYYKSSSNENNSYAKNNLGVIFKYKNIEYSKEILMEAIKLKNDYSIYNLAKIYYFNDNDEKEAINLLKQASNHFLLAKVFLNFISKSHYGTQSDLYKRLCIFLKQYDLFCLNGNPISDFINFMENERFKANDAQLHSQKQSSAKNIDDNFYNGFNV